jgi:uncharacterized protein (DUF1501 family)
MDQNPEDRDDERAVSRRRFLALATGAGLALGAGAALGPSLVDALVNTDGVAAATAAGRTAGRTASRTSARTLVLVALYGGNDGLNTVVPYEDPNYAAARGVMALDPSSVLVLGDGYGLHPALTQMKAVWEAGNLAIVHGVGFGDPNYSHFESMDIWQAGSTDAATTTGWIGRWLDATRAGPLQAVGIGPTLAPALAGARVQGAALLPGPIQLPGTALEHRAYAAMAKTGSHEAALTAEAAQSGSDLLLVDRRLGPILDRTAAADPLHLPDVAAGSRPSASAGALAIANGGGGLSSGNVLATQLSVVANLILAGAPADVYSVELGGFDTHAAQLPTQQTLLGELDTAIPAFLDALDGSPHGDGTVVLVFTEFGRRVAANASEGTDHGWANVALAAGRPVMGGFYGQPPSLANLSEGNTVFTTDFRSLYATVLDRVVGVDPTPILGARYPTIGFV